jgi:hypothetical protein
VKEISLGITVINGLEKEMIAIFPSLPKDKLLMSLLRKAFFVKIRVFELSVIMTLISQKSNSLMRGTIALGLTIIQLITFSRKRESLNWMSFLRSARTVLHRQGFGDTEIKKLIDLTTEFLDRKEAFLSEIFEFVRFEGRLEYRDPSSRTRKPRRPRTPSAVGSKSQTPKPKGIGVEFSASEPPEHCWEEIHSDSLSTISKLRWESIGNPEDFSSKPTEDERREFLETFQRILSKGDERDEYLKTKSQRSK